MNTTIRSVFQNWEVHRMNAGHWSGFWQSWAEAGIWSWCSVQYHSLTHPALPPQLHWPALFNSTESVTLEQVHCAPPVSRIKRELLQMISDQIQSRDSSFWKVMWVIIDREWFLYDTCVLLINIYAANTKFKGKEQYINTRLTLRFAR